MKKTYFLISLFSLVNVPMLWSQTNANLVDKITLAKNGQNELLNNSDKIDENAIYIIEKRALNSFQTPKVKINVLSSITIKNSTTKNKVDLPTEFTPSVSISKERKNAIAYIFVPQYKKNGDGSIEKITNYSLEVIENNTTAQKTTGSRIYANQSVLASGNWYRISTTSPGIYKIDYDFIKFKLGVDPATINTNNIRIYGNGGTMLDESNKTARHDDLVENAIQVNDGGGDGQFNQGDYILFYANGPHLIVKDSVNKLFSHEVNLYNDISNYFINFDLGAGKRVSLTSTPNTFNQTVTSFNEFLFHEKDSVNHGKFGKLWWGDELNDLPGRSLNKTFSFSIPNLESSTPVTFSIHSGAITHAGGSSINFSVNGTSLNSSYFSPFGFEFFDPTIRTSFFSKALNISNSTINVNANFIKGGADAAGFINYIQLNARRNLFFNGYLNFADWNSVGSGNIAQYQLENANANTQIWDITNDLIPQKIATNLNGTLLTFNQTANYLHRFVAFDGSVVNTPNFIEKVANQNLHQLKPVDYIIVSHPNFLYEANQLAQYHATKRGYKTIVVTPQQIYNEFSSGSQDISAIRDFIKMLYDKATTPSEIPSYVLFFGDASFDYKNRVPNNTNFVPTYETPESLSKTAGYCSDDFFGFLDDEENLNDYNVSQINTLDIGIGRITVSAVSKAKDVISKILNYDSPNSFGPWKNNITFNADDGDNANHLDDAEIMANTLNTLLPVYNAYKIYVDGYVRESTPAGPRTPDANSTIRQQLFNGTFLMNYNGHGGPNSWCEERIFSLDDINSLKNKNKLPLFLTATCDFAPFDNPYINSAGEILLTKSDGGAIALMTTTQLVYADQNRIMNQNYIQEGFKPMANGKFPTLGDAYRLSKNLRYTASVSEFVASNFRKFALLGDPGLPLAFPIYDVITDSINGNSVSVKIDTINALNKYTISGHVADKQGNLASNFNGIVYPTIFDKPKKQSTLQNNGDPKRDYYLQNNAIYKGKATVKNGKFSFTFVVPKDINYDIAAGKISYYANTETEDANGYNKDILIGGSSLNPNTDNQGPLIKAFMNNENFVDGGIVNANSTLLVKLSDDNGINYTGNSIGHDITAILDDNAQNTFVLNNFFEADLDDYRSGIVRFPVENLSVGIHTLTIKAWDIFNNSAETKIAFEVVNSTEGIIKRVYNYPNPFTTKTQFMFEHNMPNQDLYVSIQIFSTTGKMVKSIKQVVNSEGTRVNNIEWDGLDEFGDQIGKGTYLYKLHVKSANGFSDSKMEKLIILR